MTEFPFFIASRLALGSTKSPIQWPVEALSCGVTQLVCQADHSPTCSTEVKNNWSYSFTPPYAFIVRTEAIYSGILRKKCRMWNHCLFLVTFNPCMRPRHRLKDNVNMEFKEIGWEGMNWIDLGQDRE